MVFSFCRYISWTWWNLPCVVKSVCLREDVHQKNLALTCRRHQASMLPSSVPRSDQAVVELSQIGDEAAVDGEAAVGGEEGQPVGSDAMADPQRHIVPKLPKYSATSMILTILPGSLLGTIDQGVVDVCLVTIANDLNAPMHTAQWVLLVYLLVMASTAITAGRLGDRYSKPRMYQIGLLIFTASSAGCGFSTSIEMLIAMRAVQGLGSSLMGSNSLAMIKYFTKPEETSIAMGYAGSLVGLGMSLGPPLGGLLTHAFGWQSVFFINLPVGVLALVTVHCRLPDTPAGRNVSLDPVGSLLVFAAIGGSMFTLSISHGQSAERTLGMALGSLLLLGTLVLWLRYAAKPLIPRPVLASWPIRCGLLSACGLYFGVALARYMLPLYLQTAMGFTQAHTGLALMCQPVTLLLVGLGSGRLVKRIGAKAQTALSFLFLAAAVLLLGVGLGSFALMGGSMVLLAMGQSLFAPANQGFVMACAADDQLSIVGALIGMCRSVALPLGIVCCTTLLTALSSSPSPKNTVDHTKLSSPSTAAAIAIDSSAARITVLLYLIPTAAAFVITLCRGEPRKTAKSGGGSSAVNATPTTTTQKA